MYKTLLHGIFILLVIFLFSCDYDPTGENEVEIELKDPPVLIFNLNDNDSLMVVASNTHCYFTFPSTVPSEIYAMIVYIDGEKLPIDGGNYFIEPAKYSFGYHQLDVVLVTPTNSGSLADILMAEGYIYHKKMNLFIENRSPSNEELPDIKSIEKYNGTLKITWKQYPFVNFKSYSLLRLKGVQPWDGIEEYEYIAEITDKGQNIYNDCSFIGGQAKYYIIVNTYASSVPGKKGEKTFPLPEVLSTSYEGSDIVVTFSKCQFPANFKLYHFYWDNIDEGIITEAGFIYNINDTVVTIKDIGFGSSVKLNIGTRPVKGWTEYYGEYEAITINNIYIGEKFFKFHDMASSYPCNEIYIMDDLLQQYSSIEDRVIKSIKISSRDTTPYTRIVISKNGTSLAVNKRYDGQVLQYNLPGLEQINVLNYFTNSNHLSISNNGIIPIASDTDLKLYSFESGTFIDTLYNSYAGFYYSTPYISHDGQVLYVDYDGLSDALYRKTPGGFIKEVVGSSSYFRFIDFNPFNPEELILYDYNLKRVCITEVSSLNISRYFSIPDYIYSNIDPVTGLFLARKADHKAEIYNITDGSKTGELKIKDEPTYRIFNGTLYSSCGYKLKLNIE